MYQIWLATQFVLSIIALQESPKLRVKMKERISKLECIVYEEWLILTNVSNVEKKSNGAMFLEITMNQIYKHITFHWMNQHGTKYHRNQMNHGFRCIKKNIMSQGLSKYLWTLNESGFSMYLWSAQWIMILEVSKNWNESQSLKYPKKTMTQAVRCIKERLTSQ